MGTNLTASARADAFFVYILCCSDGSLYVGHTSNVRELCHCRLETIGKAGANPAIAYSFSELLQRMLDSDGRVFWKEPGFKPYGDADQFTRRESTGRQKEPKQI